MAKGSGGGGKGGGVGGGGAGRLVPNAIGGSTRQIRNKKYKTADVVNQAIKMGGNLDIEGSRQALVSRGQANPPIEMVRDYATQARILGNLQRLTGANTSGQIGRWNFTNAKTILQGFESYLSRRVVGQRAEWTRKREEGAYLARLGGR